MRIACVCDTPFQVLNCLNYVYHNVGVNNMHFDLFLVDQFDGAQKIYEKIAGQKFFDNTFMVKVEKPSGNENQLKWKFRRMYAYAFPQKTITRCIGNQITKYNSAVYDIVFSAVVTCFTACLLKENPEAELDLFDDGTGSYYGNIIEKGVGWQHKLFAKVFHCGSNVVYPEKLYINNPSYCRSTSAKSILPLPNMDSEFLSFIKMIFDYSNDSNEIYKQKVIWLTRPMGYVNTIRSVLKIYKDQTLVRLHPRENQKDEYVGFLVDTTENMWEIQIAEGDIENKILLADYSTAQITPKMLFDKEPYVIFTVLLNQKIYKPNSVAKILEQINNLQEHYRIPEKIFLPKDANDLQDKLAEMLSMR